jgi:DnaK suppressor protein
VNLQHLRKLLLEKQQDLLAVRESGTQAAATVTLDQTSVGRLSRMDALQSQAMLQEAARRREQLLQQIAGALQRIDSGDYGYCELCDDEIAEKRLEINPAVRYCIVCSSRLEES